MTKLVTRKINITFQLGTGSFGTDGSDKVEITGLRTSAVITKAGGASMSTLELQVWGMPLDTMQKLTVLNKLAYAQERDNTVTLIAGDDESGLGVVFTGTIKEAWADASNAPDVLFTVSAFSGGLDAVKPVAPVSYQGSVSVDTVLGSIAAQMTPPHTLENSGVQVTLDNPYLPGTLRDQALAVARAARCNMLIDEQVLAIWPLGETRGSLTLDISAETGLVGYPQFTQNGIALSVLFTPSLVFGQTIKVTSALAAANGSWVVAAVQHNLDAELPGGQWFTRVECGLLGHPAPIIGTPA